MKNIFLVIFAIFFTIKSEAQLIKSDSLELVKKGYIAGIFSNKNKGLIVVNQDNSDDTYLLTYFSENLSKEWAVKVKKEDFGFTSNYEVAYPDVIFTDNYVYLYVKNMPNARVQDFETKQISKVFYQISLDGESKKGLVNLKKEEVMLKYFSSNDTLIAYYYNEKTNVSSDALIKINPLTLNSTDKIKIKSPENGWMLNDIYNGQAYYMGVDDINPNFKFQKKLVSNTISGNGYSVFFDGKLNKEIAYEYTSDNYRPCPDYRISEERQTSAHWITRYRMEAPFTNFQYDFDNNDLYVYGFLSASTYSDFYKKAFYLLKYKTSGRKIFTKVCEFDTLSNYNASFQKFISNSPSYRTNLLIDEDNIYYFITSLRGGYGVIQMNKKGDIKKILTPDRTEFGLWDYYSVYRENLMCSYYSNVEYKEGDDNIIKTVNDLKVLFKKYRKPMVINVLKLNKYNVIAVLNKVNNKIYFYQYPK